LAKKGKGKKYLVGGIVVIAVLAVLLVDLDDIADIQILVGNELVFKLPTPNSLLDEGFFAFQPSDQFPLHAVECKVKQETKIYDINGKLSRTEHSDGIQGNPLFALSLVTPANVQVSHYTVIPKIFCEVNDSFPPIFIKPSDLTVQVYAQLNPASEQRTLVFTENIRTFEYSFPSPPNQVAEPSLGVVTIRASDIESKFADKDFNSQLEFKVFGTLKLSFDDPSIGNLTYEIPIGKDQLRTFYVQPVRTDNEPDSDGDGIVDSADDCPNQAENFNGFEDQDGCPDVKPTNTGTNTGGTPTTVITQVECNNLNQTWFVNISGGGEVCFGGALISQGSFCKVYDSSLGHCIDTATSTTGGTTVAEDKITCINLGGFYKENPNNLVSTQLFTPTQLSGQTVHELDTGMCLVPIDTQNPPCLTASCVIADAKDGKIVTIITITYVDRTTETVLASTLSTFRQGFVTNQLFTTEDDGTIREISTVKYETFYTRKTLDLAQDQKFVGGGVQFNPLLTIGGFIIQLQPVPATGSEQNLFGHTINQLTNTYGFSLGHRVLTAQEIESKIPEELAGIKTVSINMAVDGVITIQKDGVSGSVNIQGEQSTLTGVTVKIEPKSEICRFPNVIDPITLECHPPIVVCTPPLIKNIQGICELPKDDEDYQTCHDDFDPPKEFVGNECKVIIVGQLGGEPCTDSHPHISFTCSPNYRELFCDAQNFCGNQPPPTPQCTPPLIRVSGVCVNPPDICQDGQTNASNGCIERPSVSYCLSIGEFYDPDTNTCQEAPKGDCDNAVYRAFFPELCKNVPPTPNTCEAIGKVTATCGGIDICYDACVVNTTYSCDFGRCLVDCPTGQIRIFPDAQCHVAPEGDRDGDGYLDNVDACPDRFGSEAQGSTDGCPVCVGGGCDKDPFRDLLNDPLFQIGLVVFVILIGTVVIIRRRNSF